MTYSAPLKVTIRLTITTRIPIAARKPSATSRNRKFLCDIPLMTENGTFIINGRSASSFPVAPLAGRFFESANNRSYFLGKIIPYRGSWVEFEYDTKNILYVRIDRKRKFLGSSSCARWDEVQRRHSSYILSGRAHFAARQDSSGTFRRESWNASWPRNPQSEIG